MKHYTGRFFLVNNIVRRNAVKAGRPEYLKTPHLNLLIS